MITALVTSFHKLSCLGLPNVKSLNTPIRAFLLNRCIFHPSILINCPNYQIIWKDKHVCLEFSKLHCNIQLKWKCHTASLHSWLFGLLAATISVSRPSQWHTVITNMNLNYVICNCGCWMNALMWNLCYNTKSFCFKANSHCMDRRRQKEIDIFARFCLISALPLSASVGIGWRLFLPIEHFELLFVLYSVGCCVGLCLLLHELAFNRKTFTLYGIIGI